MVVNSRYREICHGCSKNILKHHTFVICKTCERICHGKCSDKLYIHDFIDESWCCWECSSKEETRYNPFKSYRYDKYSNPDNDINDITQIENILEKCSRYNLEELNGVLKNTSSSMTVMFENIDGVASNFDLFSTKVISATNQISILTLAETNLDECNKDLFTIKGYHPPIYQSKISGKSKGSGLAIYIKELFLYTDAEEYNQCSPNLECLFIKITNTDEPVIAGVLYRPPNGNKEVFLSELENILKKLPTSNVYITGDFNINLHKNNLDDYENIIFSSGYTPLISIATHFKPGCNPSCIDNIFTNSTDSILKSGTCPATITHHSPIFCQIATAWKSCESDMPIKKYDYNESNMIKYENLLEIYLSTNNFVGEMLPNEGGFNDLICKIHELVDECFLMDESLLKSKRNRINNPWITNGIITSISKNDHLYQNWRKSVKKLKTKEGDPILYQEYKDYRKNLKAIIKCAKRDDTFKKFKRAEGNSKETWKIINEIRGKRKTKIKPSFLLNDVIIEDRRIIANSFNCYFTSIASKLNESDDGISIEPIPKFTDYIKNSCNSSIYLKDCTSDEIYNMISELSSSKSSDLPITLLKHCANILSPILSKFYNAFMRLGIFPDILKTGIVSPVYKKGNPQLLDNYRPISTLPIFSKIFEKLIYSRIYDFLISKNVLYEKQFGFRKNHSTSHAINYSVKYVSDKIEQKKHVIGIFLDLSKAFDTICHNKLMVKLHSYGIRGNCLELLKNYLLNRKQITKFNNIKSDSQNIVFGVPQGSVLGPLLFLLYINDIINSSSDGEFVVFADDTNIFITGNNKEEAYYIANKVLKSVSIYMKVNQLHINLNKCAFMHFRPNLNNDERTTCARCDVYDKTCTLSLNGQKVKKVDKIKFLGVIIDDQLSWNDQIENLENKLLTTIVLIKRLKKFVPPLQYLKIYHSLFESHLAYGISCWGGSYTSKLNKIFSLQKRCIRILFGETYSFDHPEFYYTCARAKTFTEHMAPKNFALEHTKPLFIKHGLLTVKNLYISRSLVELMKIIKFHSPISMYEFFKFSNHHSKFRLQIPKHKLDISKRNYIHNAIKFWNTCIGKILDSPVLSVKPFTKGSQHIISGNVVNSDMTIPIGLFKKRLNNLLLATQNEGSSSEWGISNSLGL